MPTAGLVFGIFSTLAALVGLVPCLGWLNWFTLFLGLLGTIFSAIGLGSEKKGQAIAGLILCLLALLAGGARLVIGGGII